MNRYKGIAVGMIVALGATACASGPAERIVTQQASKPATHECVISSDLIRIPRGIDTTPFVSLGFSVIDSPGELQERQGLARLVPDDIGARVLRRSWYVDLATASPPVDVLDVLAEFADLGASAVHAMSFEGHWSVFPGGEDDNTNLKLPGAAIEIMRDRINTKASRDTKVAIVDSGFRRFEGWEGLDVGLGPADRIDVAPSHGAFVTSILKQVAPGLEVAGAKAGFAATAYVDQDGRTFNPNGSIISDELAVEIALERLKQWAGNDPTVVNMSMGTVGCPDNELLPPPTAIAKVLDGWRGATTFAAAGNETPHHGSAFYPAAFDDVAGVGALNLATSVQGGALVKSASDLIWDNGVRVKAAVGPWVDHTAIGADVLGVGRPNPSSWSGSSFATPLIVGLYLNATNEAGVDAASFGVVKDLVPFERRPADGCQLMGLRTNGSGVPRTSGGSTALWCSPIPDPVRFGTVEASEKADRG